MRDSKNQATIQEPGAAVDRADADGAEGQWTPADRQIRDRRLRAAVVCYGRLTTDPDLLAPLRASVLGIFAGKDEGFPPETIRQFQTAMEKAGKRLAGVHVYPACGPNFMDPASPVHAGLTSPAARADAWQKIETFLAGELRR